MMRLIALLTVISASARAGTLAIAGDPPPPPPEPQVIAGDPPPPPQVIAVDPPLAPPAVVRRAPGERDRLRDRLTFLPGSGVLWLWIDGERGEAAWLQPTVTRTFDRFELQGELGLGAWHQADRGPAHAVLGRFAVTARYQAARAHIEQTLALDLVVEAGVGLHELARDGMTPARGADVSVGAGLRMLGAERPAERRVLIGLEAMGRVLFTPYGRGVMIVFGLPMGR
jgi:hypothetical protein